jgi:hypothetical protein
VEARAGFDRRRRVEGPAGLAVAGVQGDDVSHVGAQVERPVGRHRRGFKVARQLAPPDGAPGGGVAGDHFAAEEGPVDPAVVVDRRSDEVRLAPVARPVLHFPEDLAIPQPHRSGIPVLVDHIGDAAVDRRRELDQRVRVQRPGLPQGRVQQPPFARQVVRPLRHPAEEGPVDVAGIALGGGEVFVFGAARAAADHPKRSQNQRQTGGGESSSAFRMHRESVSAARTRSSKQRTPVESGGRESNPRHQLGRLRLYR